MLTHCTVTEPIYGSELTVICGDRKEFLAWARKQDPDRRWVVGKHTQGRTYTFDEQWRVWVYLPPNALDEPKHFRALIIAHECFHYTAHILNKKDLACCPDNEEAWAYFLGYAVGVVTRVVEEKWFGRKRRVKRGNQRKRRPGKGGHKDSVVPDAGGRKDTNAPPAGSRADSDTNAPPAGSRADSGG